MLVVDENILYCLYKFKQLFASPIIAISKLKITNTAKNQNKLFISWLTFMIEWITWKCFIFAAVSKYGRYFKWLIPMHIHPVRLNEFFNLLYPLHETVLKNFAKSSSLELIMRFMGFFVDLMVLAFIIKLLKPKLIFVLITPPILCNIAPEKTSVCSSIICPNSKGLFKVRCLLWLQSCDEFVFWCGNKYFFGTANVGELIKLKLKYLKYWKTRFASRVQCSRHMYYHWRH